MSGDSPLQLEVLLDQDLQRVAELERSLFSDPWSLAQLQNSLRSQRWMWVAKQQGSVVGYLVASQGGGVADLLTIGVDLCQQRAGIGLRLLTELFKRLRSERVAELFLEVRESNASAISLYRHCGFEPVALRKDYYLGAAGAENAIVMRKTGFIIE